ncbi:hypothetical protein ACNJUL_21110, partial [Mycobacterium tuberculosis]
MAIEPLPPQPVGPRPDKSQPGWGVVKFQSATIALLLLASVVVATSAHAQTSTIGRVWPIAEPDAMAEIEAKVRTLPADMST